MEGWVDLGYPALHQLGVELAIFRSLVWRPNHYTTEPPKNCMYSVLYLYSHACCGHQWSQDRSNPTRAHPVSEPHHWTAADQHSSPARTQHNHLTWTIFNMAWRKEVKAVPSAAILYFIKPEIAPFDPPTPKTLAWNQTSGSNHRWKNMFYVFN